MKSISKILFCLLSLSLFATLNNVAVAADATSSEDQRDAVRHKKREASLREMSSLRQKRDEQRSTPPSPPRNVQPQTPSPKPERASKPARNKRGA